MRLISAGFVVLAVLGLFSPMSYAQDQPARHGFWGGVDLGLGLLERSVDESEVNDSTFYMGFKGGYTINPHLRIGLELSGWLLQASDLEDPQKGKGLGQILFITRYYPFKKSNVFARFGGGYVNLWNNSPGETANQEGFGFTVGGGYDILVTRSFALSPFASFNFGDAGDMDYTAVNIGIGFILF